jgi:hypothetical protein
LTKRFKSVIYNNAEKDAFMVTQDDGTVIEFEPSNEGLYYYNFTKSIRKHEQKTLVVDTVEELQRKFTRREIEGAEKARRLYVIMGRPSEEAFKLSLKKGLVMNNPVTVTDYENALRMFGKDLGAVKGKTVRSRTEHVSIYLKCFPKEKRNIILSIDVMHLMEISFLVTVVWNIRFITVTFLLDRKRRTISHALNQVINLFRGRGHVVEEVEFSEYQNPVHTVLADNEFIVLKEDLENIGIRLNIAAKEEHVPEVERQIRVVKERARAIIQTLPYRKIPKKMKVALIQYVIYWLNLLPKLDQEYSPRDLVLGEEKLDYKKVCQLPFGSYTQVHDDLNTANTMESHTTRAINLGPTGNVQGTHHFLSLRTGELIVRRKWTELPIPLDVINHLEELAGNSRNVIELLEDDNLDLNSRDENGEIELDQVDVIEATEDEEVNFNDIPQQVDAGNTMGIDVDGVMDGEQEKEKPMHGYNLRENRKRDNHYPHRFALLSVGAELKKWGDRARDALMDELKLFLKEEVFEAVTHPSEDQKKNALRMHCFMVEKRDGRIKAQAVADGCTQKRNLEEETYSPTVRLESIMLSTLIDAHESHHVRTVDIKGAFLRAKVPEDMKRIVKMEGDLVILLNQLNDNFKIDSFGVMYLKCVKALYGHVEA